MATEWCQKCGSAGYEAHCAAAAQSPHAYLPTYVKPTIRTATTSPVADGYSPVVIGGDWIDGMFPAVERVSERWNGFVVPYVTRQVAEQIGAVFAALPSEPGVPQFSWDGDVLVLTVGGEEEEERSEPNADGLYDISFDWTWDDIPLKGAFSDLLAELAAAGIDAALDKADWFWRIKVPTRNGFLRITDEAYGDLTDERLRNNDVSGFYVCAHMHDGSVRNDDDEDGYVYASPVDDDDYVVGADILDVVASVRAEIDTQQEQA